MTSGKRRVARLFGREYAVILPSIRDPRMHVAAVLITLQVLGQTVLGFRLSVAQILICLATGAVIEFVVAFFKDSAIMWPASGLLTGNSAAFILRTPGTLHGQWWSLNGIWIFVGLKTGSGPMTPMPASPCTAIAASPKLSRKRSTMRSSSSRPISRRPALTPQYRPLSSAMRSD